MEGVFTIAIEECTWQCMSEKKKIKHDYFLYELPFIYIKLETYYISEVNRTPCYILKCCDGITSKLVIQRVTRKKKVNYDCT